MLIRHITRILNNVNYNHIPLIIKKPSYQFSNQQQVHPPNPFSAKSSQELQKLMDHTIKANSNFYPLILKALTDRIKKKLINRKFENKNRMNQQAAIMNKCLGKIFTDLSELNLQGILFLVEAFKQMQDQKHFKINEENYKFFIQKVPQRISEILGQNQASKNTQILCDIFMKMISIRRKGSVQIRILDFLVNNDLASQEKILHFLTELSNQKLMISDFMQVQELVKRYIVLCLHHQTQGHMPIEPIILYTINFRQFNMRKISQSHIKQYFKYIHRALKVKLPSISIQKRIIILREIIMYFRNLPIYMTRVTQFNEILDMIHLLSQSLKQMNQKINEIPQINYHQTLSSLIAINDHIIELYKNKKWAEINQLYKQMFEKVQKNVQNFYGLVLLKFMNFLKQKANQQQNKKNVNQFVFLSLINHIGFTGIKINEQIEKQFIQFSISFLNSQVVMSQTLMTIRSLEYITQKIMSGNLGLELSIVQQPIRKLQKIAKDLTHYEIIRLYAIMMNLKIQSKYIEEYFDYKAKNKQSQVVQNLSRTLLKKYSLPLIKKLCAQAIQKFDPNNSTTSITNIASLISFSLKASKIYVDHERDEMLKFWLHDHWDTTKQILSIQKTANFLIRYLNREMMNIQNILSSKPEISIEIFYVLMYKDNTKLRKLYEEQLKPLFKSLWFRQFCFHQYRHSFFLKLLWFYLYDYDSIIKNSHKNAGKNMNIAKIILPILRQDKSTNIYPGQSLKKNLIWSLIKQNSYNLPDKWVSFFIDFWYWSKYNGFDHKKIFENIQNSYRFTLEHITKYYPYLFNLQFKFSVYQNYCLEKEQQSNEKRPIFPWLKNIKDGGKIADKKYRQQAVLDMLATPNLRNYLIKQNPNFLQDFIKQLTSFDKMIGSAKLAESWKFYKQNILTSNFYTHQIVKQFLQWYNKQIELLYKHSTAIQLYQLCISTQIYYQYKHKYKINQNITKCVQQSVSQQLKGGNFYILKQIADNMVTIKMQDLISFMNSLIENRPLIYLSDKFGNQFIQLLNNLLQIILSSEIISQKSNCRYQLIDLFASLYKQIFMGCKINGQIVKQHQAANFIINILLCTQKQEKLKKQTLQSLEQMKQKFLQSINTYENDLISYINNSEKQRAIALGMRQVIQSFHYQATQTKGLDLLKNKDNNSQFVLISKVNKAENKCWAQFIENYYHAGKIRVLDIQECWNMFLKNENK